MNTQFPPLEITPFWEKLSALGKWAKLKFFIIYIISIIYFSLPGLNIPLLDYITLSHSSLMDQRILESYFILLPKQSTVSFSEVSPLLLQSIISMEDGTFYDHHGVNWTELRKSIKINERKNRKARGGSTITMQLAKNLYFTTKKSYIRKAKELLVTFRLEKEVAKNSLLNQYVNIIEWGDGIFGIGEASEEYFNKRPEKLTVSEANRLAAVIPSPLKFKPNQNNKYVNRRSSIIRNRYSGIRIQKEQ